MNSQQQHEKRFSFEFFPPKTDVGIEKLNLVQQTLAEKKPRFFSVTYGAGGSTRDRTFETVNNVKNRTGIDAAPHLSCVGDTKAQLAQLLNQYQDAGINRIVTLRGDLPSGMGASLGELKYASDLVAFIREQSGDHFHLEVAAYPEMHPQAKSMDADLQAFKTKVRAGANSAITQYFFNVDAYKFFVDSCEKMGLDLPIYPGIMPIINFDNLIRFSSMCGAEIPRWIRMRMECFRGDEQSIKQLGEEIVTSLCEELLAMGAPGLHFYTMNQAEPTIAIWDNLNL
ncbi:MAG: methylenetetrahydrofolate reductase [NAD(P)H] [Pseudomonadales bacterium]|jgi:methylenetetrahydrofolate reductase (NADPH)|nr:methylenetetrahydrofolate reductase [NAD(P)H] [Pseudomonadales bacterium]MCK5791621.1 methylenetetrahydrofolate reductase [NAD(P)H] [Ketobacter sp.]MEC8810216.1 methylenetetrahydrofolate reductase [NAD(P)H] [Pseudomonadota bacterium]TNC88934.1 MAG: methylenetetrahydrofolate reductase [NAD(P)H] [Alcanivorax sp.]HAG95471.1 methylenetetrahydrofolate reductase [NAD(P)H] [Gammaproteobacteria bacterium]|tara:strand:- start:18272 stop:19123 length:852 start_codon:yes stop_codon:yes gene_type:complete